MHAKKPADTDTDSRIRARAEKLWREAGKPPGGAAAFLENARELLAIENNPQEGRIPVNGGYNRPGPWGEPIEEASIALDNEGEFPTTTDQGEQQTPRMPPVRPPSGN
jgi:hypothetical protein